VRATASAAAHPRVFPSPFSQPRSSLNPPAVLPSCSHRFQNSGGDSRFSAMLSSPRAFCWDAQTWTRCCFASFFFLFPFSLLLLFLGAANPRRNVLPFHTDEGRWGGGGGRRRARTTVRMSRATGQRAANECSKTRVFYILCAEISLTER
jgi:hypothetical protein